ncbi:hypothetical protein NMY22_g9929 [Coprinellus aureogranulatus]|nr:hypothetical protein NMY22_g9929 [Coprinellus aureogranulatus]
MAIPSRAYLIVTPFRFGDRQRRPLRLSECVRKVCGPRARVRSARVCAQHVRECGARNDSKLSSLLFLPSTFHCIFPPPFLSFHPMAQVQKRCFKVEVRSKPKAVHYKTTKAEGPPIESGEPGDLYQDTKTRKIWVFSPKGSWTPRILGSSGRAPLQQHPIHRHFRLYSDGLQWVNRRAWYPGSKRPNPLPPPAEDDDEVQLVPAEDILAGSSSVAGNPVPHSPTHSAPPTSRTSPALLSDASSLLVTTPQSTVTTSTPIPLPAALVLEPVSVPVSVHQGHVEPVTAANPGNAWLADVRMHCLKGPVSLVPGQVTKIDAIFRALLAKDNVIPRIGKDIGPTNSGLVMVGRAERSGPSPTTRDAVVDLRSAKSIAFSDSTTNFIESDVTADDFIAQQLDFGNAVELPVGHRLITTFDIPFTDGGLGKCRYLYVPFKEGCRSTILGPMANSWTPAGAVTYPHYDDFACGMYMIHWRGEKVWLLWPGTEVNLRHMEFIHTMPGDLATTLMLIKKLEGLQIMHLTEEEFREYAFYLRITTIHCCISVTESCHAGRPVRTVDFSFLPDLEVAYRSASDWMTNRLLTRASVDEDKKRELVLALVESINHWVDLHEQLPAGAQKKNLARILDKTRAQLRKNAQSLGIMRDANGIIVHNSNVLIALPTNTMFDLAPTGCLDGLNTPITYAACTYTSCLHIGYTLDNAIVIKFPSTCPLRFYHFRPWFKLPGIRIYPFTLLTGGYDGLAQLVKLYSKRGCFYRHDFKAAISAILPSLDYGSYLSNSMPFQVPSTISNDNATLLTQSHRKEQHHGGGRQRKAKIYSLEELQLYGLLSTAQNGGLADQYTFLKYVSYDDYVADTDIDPSIVASRMPVHLVSDDFQISRLREIAREHGIDVHCREVKAGIVSLLSEHTCEKCKESVCVFLPPVKAEKVARKPKAVTVKEEEILPHPAELVSDFPPEPPSEDLIKSIVLDWCRESSPHMLEEDGCAVCGQLSPLQTLTALKDMPELDLSCLQSPDSTRTQRHSVKDRITGLKGPVVDSNCSSVCPTCLKSLKVGKKPKLALANGLWCCSSNKEAVDN